MTAADESVILIEHVEISINTGLVVTSRLRLVPLGLFVAGRGTKICAISVQIDWLDKTSLSLTVKDWCVYSSRQTLHGVASRCVGTGRLVVSEPFGKLCASISCVLDTHPLLPVIMISKLPRH